MNDQHTQWNQINDQHLSAYTNWLVLRLQQLAQSAHESTQSEADEKVLEEARLEIDTLENQQPPPALSILGNALSLSDFDKRVLMLAASMEFNTRIAGLCALAQGDPNKPYPTFALAFALFDNPDWSTLSPHSPLRYWRLIEINQPGNIPLTAAALAADERITNYLKGLNYLDDRITPLLDTLPIDAPNKPLLDKALPISQQNKVDTIITRVQSALDLKDIPIIELRGHDLDSKRLVATAACGSMGLHLQFMTIKSLPTQINDFETFARLWQRECLLMPLALYINIHSAGELELSSLDRLARRMRGIIFIDSDEDKSLLDTERLLIEIDKPSPEEQQLLWIENLQGESNDQSKRLAEQFSFSQTEIKRIAKSNREFPDENNLWQRCRFAARAGMERLARRIDSKATWEQLVLPDEQVMLLRQITNQVAHRNRVYMDWGFREKMNRGLGINALFSGESGTGKTMAAEVIANDLMLDLYRIDLSSVVSKYIGETEKNLRKLFDAAEDSGAILFFDEADALFGKRSEVKDSHDRYANIEINYLLQRMESYRGLAILATNMKSALDKAFVRRLRFIVDFPFPDIEQRSLIWEKVFTALTPLDEGLDWRHLAKFNLTGGNIHNVALNAAFLAAQSNCAVSMPLLLDAARTEFKKLERPAKESDFRWITLHGANST